MAPCAPVATVIGAATVVGVGAAVAAGATVVGATVVAVRATVVVVVEVVVEEVVEIVDEVVVVVVVEVVVDTPTGGGFQPRMVVPTHWPDNTLLILPHSLWSIDKFQRAFTEIQFDR